VEASERASDAMETREEQLSDAGGVIRYDWA
jgi:hypothetical protein